MSVYKDKRTNSWCYKFVKNGVQYHRCFKGSSKEDVLDFEARLKSDLLQNKYDILDPTKDVTLLQIIKEYKEYREVNYRRPKEFDYVIDNFYKLTGNKLTSQVVCADIEKYRQHRIGKVANSSVNREINSIKKLFSLAVTNRHIKFNPGSEIKKLRVKNHVERFLTSEEERKLLEKANPIMRLIILVALHTGMRQGEILNLNWEHINFQRGYLTALDTKNGTPRSIPLTATLKKELKDFPRISKFVFANPKTKTRYVNIKKTFGRTVERAGINKITFHQLRHSSATRMVEKGSDLVVVKEILGHSNLNITQLYTHAVPKRVLDAIKTLNDYSSKSSRKPKKSTKNKG